ncbi:unnamed protein product [Sphenostylis stenocarpa]|uniref:Uncharacterized protein n=1 Tax=Sphenostylis stenocarpa TaxID=92480 RepID=A0AA86VBU3_9FABA|nr:unnamed protein product [Sphenostylis stenocarpa]
MIASFPSYHGHIHTKTLMRCKCSSTSYEQVKMPRDLDFGICRLPKRTSGDVVIEKWREFCRIRNGLNNSVSCKVMDHLKCTETEDLFEAI